MKKQQRMRGNLISFLPMLIGTGLILLLTPGAQAQTYAAAVTDPFNLSGVGGMVKPAFADLDADGDLDILTGSNYGGNGATFVYYENTGSVAAPSYAAGIPSAFGMSTNDMSTFVGGVLSPTFVDLDNDGDYDLVTGNQSGESIYYQNTGTAYAPVFAAPVKGFFGLYGVGYFSVHAFADLDSDGDQDVLIGEYYGDLFYFENTGTASSPSFTGHVLFPFGLSDVGLAVKPVFTDLDKDGDQDLLVGTQDGSHVYFENTGDMVTPAFAAPVTNPFGLTSTPAIYCAPVFCDLDADDDLDVLAGDNTNVFKYYENVSPLPQPDAPSNSTTPENLVVCYGTPATLSAAGRPNGVLSWYDAPTAGNWLGSGSLFITAPLTADATFYVQDSTGGGASPSRVAVAITVAAQIADKAVSASVASFCISGDVTVELAASANGVSYTLRNDLLEDIVIGSPQTGTGDALTFDAGAITTTTTWNIIAQTETPRANTSPLTCTREMSQTPSVAIRQPASNTVLDTVCYGTDYTYADGTIAENITEPVSHISTLAGEAANGCDSLVTENITPFEQLLGSVTTTICQDEAIIVNETVYNAANPTGTEIFTGSHGCDSTVTIALNVLPAITHTLTTTICQDEEIIVNETAYNAANPIGTEVLTAANGCDSTVTIALNVLPAITHMLTATVCHEDEIIVNETVYGAANPNGTEVLTAANGCDSTVTIALNVLPAVTGTVTSTICHYEQVFVNGTPYGAANPNGTEIMTAANGCDSTVTIALNVLPEIDMEITANGFTYTVGASGATYEWMNCNTGMIIPGETAQSFTPAANGLYRVIVTQNNCTVISGCFTVNTLGLAELQSPVLVLYPNPAESGFKISGLEKLTDVRAIRILDMQGKVVGATEEAIADWSVQTLESGVYQVQILHGKGVEMLRLIRK